MKLNFNIIRKPLSDTINSSKDIYLSESYVQFIYDTYFIGNLKKMVQEKENLSFRWMHIDELGVMKSKMKTPFKQYIGDSFLENMDDDRELARDIMNNGTYWHIVVAHTDSIQNEVFKGSHRVKSAKMLGCEWNRRGFMAIDLIHPVNKKLWEYYSKDKNLLHDNMYYVPLLVLYPSMYSHGADIALAHNAIKKKGGKIIDDNIVQIPLPSFKHLLRTMSYFSIYLREFIYKVRKRNGSIKPNILVNDKEYFDRWMDNAR